MPVRTGDQVTVRPTDSDPYILQFQRHVTVGRIVDEDSCYVRVRGTMPPNQEVGPIPTARLLPGWYDSNGKWIRW